MAAPQKARQEEVDPYLLAGQRAIDTAPAKGKGTYLRPIPGLPDFDPKEGLTYRLVFLAWTAGKGNRTTPVGQLTTIRHFGIHPQVGINQIKLACRQHAFGEPCASCELFGRLRADPSNKGKEAWKQISGYQVKDRELRLVHNLDGAPGNLMRWDESYHLFGKFFVNMVNRREDWKGYAHPTKGSMIEITGTKKAIENNSCTEFNTIIISRFSAEFPPPPMSLYEKARKLILDDSIIYLPYAEYEKILYYTVDPPADAEAPADDTSDQPTAEYEAPADEPAAEAEYEAPADEPAAEYEVSADEVSADEPAAEYEATADEPTADEPAAEYEATADEQEAPEQAAYEEQVYEEPMPEPEAEPEPEPEPEPAPPPRRAPAAAPKPATPAPKPAAPAPKPAAKPPTAPPKAPPAAAPRPAAAAPKAAPAAKPPAAPARAPAPAAKPPASPPRPPASPPKAPPKAPPAK